MDAPRRQVGAELAGKVAGADVVRRHNHDRRTAEGVGVVGERGDQVGLDRSRGVGIRGFRGLCGSRQRTEIVIRVCELQQRPQCHL
jgi:hypothetical protein